MPTLEVEAWSTRAVDVSQSVLAEIAASGLVTVSVDGSGASLLVADSRVGTVSGAEWVVRVVPRLRVPKLMFLLGYAVDPNGWKDDAAEAGEDEELLPAVASAFAFHAIRAVEPNPLRGYVTIEERSTTLRGRMRTAEQLRRGRGLALPLEVAYDDFVIDVIENRMLLAASELLLRFPQVPIWARSRLLTLRRVLDGVTPAEARPTVPPITRLSRRYAPALRLATLILRGASIEWRGNSIAGSRFVFDMNKVFEDFLSAALIVELRRFGGEVRLQDQTQRLDERGSIRLKPDISWWRNGAPVAVVDAKYKKLTDARFPNADAYQMLAYCTAMQLPTGFLVYAKDKTTSERKYEVVHGGPELRVQTIDVELSPADVLAQVTELAAKLAATTKPITPTP